jgi:hypothetical protein
MATLHSFTETDITEIPREFCAPFDLIMEGAPVGHPIEYNVHVRAESKKGRKGDWSLPLWIEWNEQSAKPNRLVITKIIMGDGEIILEFEE